MLTDAEVRALMAACGDGPVGLRHRALLALMYRAGLRISEALFICPRDVDRVVGLDPGAGVVEAAWAELWAVLAVPTGASSTLLRSI